MIKKVEKEFDNHFGLEKLDESYSFDKPILLTMIPVNMSYRDINGYFSQLMYLLQIRSSNVDSNYTIGDMPFDMISGEFRDKLYEKIIKNIPIGDTSAAKKYMRNINIFSYCAGNTNTTQMLQKIHDYLEENNYKQDEIKEIMKEIFVLQIIDNNYNNNYNNNNNNSFTPIPFATTVIVQDIYDLENYSHVLDFNSDNPFISTMQINGTKYILYNSFGEKSLYEEEREHEFKNDYVLAPIVNAVMSLYMIKAISNSLSNSPKKDISIYHELQEFIKIAQEFIKRKNKTPEELTINEKEELNKLLFEEIKRIFPLYISTKILNDDEKKYLMEKDSAINYMKSKKILEVFSEYNKCLELIDQIIYTYNNYTQGEIICEKNLGNSNIKVSVTREDEIISKLGLLEQKFDSVNQLIGDIELPDSISPMIKDEFSNKLKLILENLKNKIYSNEFQHIIEQISPTETKLKRR